MSSHPISVRNKSSKFTLTKKEFHEGINKIANNAIAIKNLNSINNYQSEFSQYNEYLSSKFTAIYKKIRKVKSYPLPPSVGALIGANVIGIGFVRKISNREK